jgi:hypothetical protein
MTEVGERVARYPAEDGNRRVLAVLTYLNA